VNNVNDRTPCISEIFCETVRDSNHVKKIFHVIICIITIIILIIKSRYLVLPNIFTSKKDIIISSSFFFNFSINIEKIVKQKSFVSLFVEFVTAKTKN